MSVPAPLLHLIEVFGRNAEAYRRGAINETETRVQFIDPLFGLLGWDMHNTRGYSEAFKDVVHEDAVRIEGTPRAPDYGFRVGGQRVFFLEAKKPAVNLEQDASPALQLRRYAWTCKLPLSILTDFEEFAVYDTRVKPVKTDKASAARIQFIRYTEYPEQWERLSAVFSKEAVLQGSFHKYAEAATGKKGTAGVDTEFLAEIERWRDTLARTIALRNPALSQRELNFAVQKTIDRIIFLRMCEDRGIEPYGQLLALVNGAQVYPRLLELFFAADQRYNSGLFHFHREKDVAEAHDSLTPAIALDDKPLKDIFRALYYPDCPYQFSVLPIQILGDVYEQFLGKVIRLTPGHQAKIEYKPEVRKAGGVQYTPAFVTGAIVKNTIGTLIARIVEGAAAISDAARRYASVLAAVDKLTICDPACGSGSFLIAAYQYLLDWYLQWYVQHEALALKAKTPPIHQTRNGEWRLATAEKKRILLNSMFGVDIDSQAVEVTKLSLLLKVLEGENEESINTQLKLFHERALPNLSSNIKCGNSLIGPDFYAQHEMQLLDEEERLRINVFDWRAAFPRVFSASDAGFSAIIGNPPYVRQETLGAAFKQYAATHFSTYAGTADLYVYFIEQGHKLLQKGGLLGFICCNKFMRASYGRALRQFLAKNTTIRSIIDFGELPVFKGAATFPALIYTENTACVNQRFLHAAIKRLDFTSLDEEVAAVGQELDDSALRGDNWTLAPAHEVALFEKMKQRGIPLGEYVQGRLYYGIKTGYNQAFVIDAATRARLIKEDANSAELIKPFVIGDDIRKYHIRRQDRYLILIPCGWTRASSDGARGAWDWFAKNYPAIASHLEPHKEACIKRADQGEYWWELRPCDYYRLFESAKIIYPDIAKESRMTLDRSGIFFGNTAYMIPVDDPYLLSILNSRLVFHYYRRNASVLGDAEKGGRMRWFTQDVIRIPIRVIDFNNADDKKCHQQMTQHVETMLGLHKRLAAVRTPGERSQLENQITATDRLIDQLVYQLYGLTDDEIRIVEQQA